LGADLVNLDGGGSGLHGVKTISSTLRDRTPGSAGTPRASWHCAEAESSQCIWLLILTRHQKAYGAGKLYICNDHHTQAERNSRRPSATTRGSWSATGRHGRRRRRLAGG
jgi:hypothetical protein